MISAGNYHRPVAPSLCARFLSIQSRVGSLARLFGSPGSWPRLARRSPRAQKRMYLHSDARGADNRRGDASTLIAGRFTPADDYTRCAVARLDARLRDFSKERCRLPLMGRNGMLIAAYSAGTPRLIRRISPGTSPIYPKSRGSLILENTTVSSSFDIRPL